MQIGVESAKAVDQRRVFVVDDDEVTRAALQFMLQDEIETHELSSMEAAYERTTDWLKPDLILLGASLLRPDAPGQIAAIKRRFAPVRILIVCDKADEALALDAIKAGAHGAIVKPITIQVVRKKVDTVLGREGGENLIQIMG